MFHITSFCLIVFCRCFRTAVLTERSFQCVAVSLWPTNICGSRCVLTEPSSGLVSDWLKVLDLHQSSRVLAPRARPFDQSEPGALRRGREDVRCFSPPPLTQSRCQQTTTPLFDSASPALFAASPQSAKTKAQRNERFYASKPHQYNSRGLI